MRYLTGVLFLVLAGCISMQPAPTAKRSDSRTYEPVNKRNYTLGEEQSATVGSAIMSLRAYQLVHITERSPILTVNEPCTLRLPLEMSKTFQPGDAAQVVGTTDCDGQTCTVINVGKGVIYSWGARITPDGRVVGVAINMTFNNKAAMTFSVTPPTCRFVHQETEKTTVSDTDPYRNFEILYGGIDGQTMHFTYREYSADDLIRPAFSQAFSYPVSSAEVRFKDVVIRVIEARPESLRYVVTADGTK